MGESLVPLCFVCHGRLGPVWNPRLCCTSTVCTTCQAPAPPPIRQTRQVTYQPPPVTTCEEYYVPVPAPPACTTCTAPAPAPVCNTCQQIAAPCATGGCR